MIIYKSYQIKPSKQIPTMLSIVTDGKGGSIPDAFSGLYTSYHVAKMCIDNYLLQKELMAVADDKKINKTRV